MTAAATIPVTAFAIATLLALAGCVENTGPDVADKPVQSSHAILVADMGKCNLYRVEDGEHVLYVSTTGPTALNSSSSCAIGVVK